MPTRHRKKETTVKDPQCGGTVDPEKAAKLDWEGKTYFFCSEECRKNFDRDPPGDASFREPARFFGE